MKPLKPLLLVFAFLLMSNNTQAQFWKKLTKRAEEAVKETVLRKAEEKAAQTAEKSMDKLFDLDFSQQSKDPSILPENYEFEWKYRMQMKSKKNAFDFVYYLKPDAPYYGAKPELQQKNVANGMFMVHDNTLNVMTVFTNSNGKKMGHIVSLPSNLEDEVAKENEAQIKDMTFEEIGTKEILGYTCQGFQLENKEVKMTMYFTFDAPVSFNQVFGGKQSKILPKGFDPKWLKKADNSLMMEMTYINKKKKKHSATMTCVGLDEVPKTITVSDYEFMKLNTSNREDH